MDNLNMSDRKEIIQMNLDSLKVTEANYMSQTFFVKTPDKDFENNFIKNMANSINTYLESKGLDPKTFSRSLTYTVTNKDNNFVITF